MLWRHRTVFQILDGRLHGVSKCVFSSPHFPSDTYMCKFLYFSYSISGRPGNSTMPRSVNSLAPGRFQFNFRWVIFQLTFVNGGWGFSHEIALRWMPLDLTDDKSTLVQVMAWCRQTTSHYLSQCWPWYMSPNGVTRPQWVKDDQWHGPAKSQGQTQAS